MPSIDHARGKQASELIASESEARASEPIPSEEKRLSGGPALAHTAGTSTRFISRLFVRYLVAVSAVGLAFLIRAAIVRQYGELPPYITFYPVILLVAMLGDIWAGLLATWLSALLALDWVLRPEGRLATSRTSDAVGLAIFCTMGICISVVAELYHRNREKLAAYQTEEAVRNERRKADEERKVAEATHAERRRLLDVLETLPTMICLLTPDHHVAFANRSFREKFGESRGRHCYEYRFGRTEPCNFCETYNVLKTGKPHHWEVTSRDGSLIDVYDIPFTDMGGSPLILEMKVDITDRRRAEAELQEHRQHLEELVQQRTSQLEATNAQLRAEITERQRVERNQELATKVLRVLNRGGDLHASIGEVLGLLKEATGFDALGIRLREGEDFPYYQQEGFSAAFLREENFLCAKGADSSILRDTNGQAVLECTCGLVLSGRTDPSMSCFTEGGSFWTNQSSELLGLAPEADPRQNPRNRCIHAGYESVALVPVRSGDQIIGLLQLNDRQPGRFTLERIRFFEGLANYLGLALRRRLAEEAVRESEERFRALVAASSDVVYRMSPDWSEMRRLRGGDFIVDTETPSRTWLQKYIHPDDRPRVMEVIHEAIRTKSIFELEHRVLRVDGSLGWTFSRAVPLLDANDEIVEWFGAASDVTARKRAEEALHRYELLAGHSRDIILFIRYNDGHILEANAAAMHAYGYSREELLSLTIQDLRAPDTRVLTPGEMEIADRQGILFESVHLRKDGATFPVEVSSQGATIGGTRTLISVIRDITERKRAEEALRTKDAELEAIITRTPFMLTRCTRDLRYKYVSRAYANMVGRTPDQIAGKPIIEIMGEKGFRTIRPHVEKVLRGETVEYEASIHFQGVGSRRLWVVYVPDTDERGQITGWFTSTFDITERKRVEEALRESEERFRSMYAKAAVGIQQLANDGRLLMVNEAFCRMLGYSESELLGRDVMDLTHPDDRAVNAAVRGPTLRGERDWHEIEKRYIHRDGFPVWVHITSSVVRDTSGHPLYRVAIVQDVTQRKQAEEALLRSEKLASVGRMAASIAHEINNPLEAVTNVLFLAKALENLPEPARRYLEIADEELKRIAHITRQSLGFYRESSAPTPTSVTAVLESAVDLLQNKIKTKQALVEKQWDGDVQITAMAGELRQVFSNFLVNSLDALDDEGIITLRVSTSTVLSTGNRQVRITVADNGKGISATTRQHLFEPFVTTKGAVGTGLGLWVSKQIIDKHGGTIRVRSSTDGNRRGTVVSVVLPLEPLAEARSQSASA
jgi:PAS domain S-box-containing protein